MLCPGKIHGYTSPRQWFNGLWFSFKEIESNYIRSFSEMVFKSQDHFNNDMFNIYIYFYRIVWIKYGITILRLCLEMEMIKVSYHASIGNRVIIFTLTHSPHPPMIANFIEEEEEQGDEKLCDSWLTRASIVFNFCTVGEGA